MPDGVVTGEYRLTTVQARRELNHLEREAKDTDRSMEKLGRDMDTVGSTRQVRQVRTYRGEVHRLAGTSRDTERAERGLRRETDRLGNSFDKATHGRRGGGGGGGGVRGGVLGLSGGMRQMALMAAAALPAIRSLSGAIGSLATVVASAAGGAGAVGVAGLGGLLVGLGGIAAVAIPAKNAIKEAADAQKKYNDTIRQYGRASKEARAARGETRRAYRAAPRGTRSLIAEADQFKKAWKEATKSGQESIVGFAREVVRTGRRMTPFLAEISNQVTKAFSAQGARGLEFLRGRTVRRGLRAGAGIFTENLGNVRRVGQATVEIFMNVMRAARPFVKEFTNFTAAFFGRAAARTRNIEKLRGTIRNMVDDLKSLGRLGGASGRLIMALLGQGARAEGRSLIEDTTRQLNRWTDWIKANPAKVRAFFRDTAEGTRQLASALRDIAGLLSDMSRTLMPLLRGLSTLTGLASNVGAIGTVGLGSAALGAFRGARGKPKGPGPAGTIIGGLLGLGGRGGGAARGGAGAAKMAAGIKGAATVPRAGMLARGGGLLRGAAMGAGKAYWPIAAAMAGLGAASTDGGFYRRLTGAASMVIPGVKQPKAYSELEAIGQERAASFAGGVPQDSTLTGARLGAGQIGGEARRLRGRLGATETFQQAMGPGGGMRARTRQAVRGDQRIEVAARATALEAEAKARREVVAELTKERDVRLKAVSIARGGRYAGQFQEGYRRRVRHGATAQEAFGVTRRAVGRQMAGMHPEGARELAEQTLTWANKMRRDNPKLQGEYEKLASGIEKRLHRLHVNVRVVQGQILDGSDKQWGQIANKISSQARRGVDATAKEYQRLNQIALGALKQMGYDEREAKMILAGQRKGGSAATKARQTATTSKSYRSVAAFGGPTTGDGLGFGDGAGVDRPSMGTVGKNTVANKARAAGGVGLMGAKAGLGVYANDAANYGLRVSSGSRPGAITVSGNTSYHSSGDAIDLAGPSNQMLAFAKHLSSTAGGGIDELIHTPLGSGQIKNGKPYVYSGAVAAGHYDHVHVADRTPPGSVAGGGGAMPGGAGAGGVPTLRARASGLAGPGGRLADAATSLIAAGMNDRLQSVAAASGGPGGGGGGVMTQSAVAQLAESVGLPGVAFAQIARGESGFNPRAVGHDPGGTQGLGLWQITTGFNDDLIKRFGGRDAMFDPQTNAMAAKAIYDRQGIKAWYGTKYLTDPTAHYTGTGDGPGFSFGGGSTVSGGGGGGRRAGHGPIAVHISMNNVRIGSASEGRSIADQLGQQVARQIAAALREAPMTPQAA